MTHAARRLIDDLLNVEVDVIVDDDIGSDAKVPTMASVVDRYERWLANHLPEIAARWSAFTPTDRDLEIVERARLGATQVVTERIEERVPRNVGRAVGGGATAGAGDGDRAAGVLRDAAIAEARCRILLTSSGPPDSDWIPVLRRIRGTIEQFATLPPNAGNASVDEVRIVRKAAEIGTATICAQSVVQLDGDIVLRADDESFLTPERRALRELHAHAVDDALAHWRVLVDFAGQMTMAAAGLATTIVRAARSPASTLRRWNERRKDNVEASGRALRELLDRKVLRDTWREFDRIRRELLDDGGITVESPDGAGDHAAAPPVYARTVIQPDGDALWFVLTDVASDGDRLDEHATRVAAVYQDRGAVVATLQRYVAALQVLVSTGVGAIGAVVAVALTDGFASLLGLALTGIASTGLVAGARRAIGWTLRRGLRTTMS